MPNVIGVFENSAQAEATVERLSKAGFGRNKITLLGGSPESRQKNTSGHDQTGNSKRGEISDSLTTIGVPPEDAKVFEGQVSQGMVLVAIRAESEDEADRAVDLMEVQGAMDVEGGNDDQGNVEAAPEYEGSRQYDSEPNSLDERDIAPAEQPISDFPEGEWSLDRQDDETNGEAGRVRVYRPAKTQVERTGPLPDEFERR